MSRLLFLVGSGWGFGAANGFEKLVVGWTYATCWETSAGSEYCNVRMLVSTLALWLKTENSVFKSEFAWETGISNCKTSPAGEMVLAEILFVWSQDVTTESASEEGLTYSATCSTRQRANGCRNTTTCLFWRQMLAIAGAARVGHCVQLILEPSNVVGIERDAERELLIGWSRASAHETLSRSDTMFVNDERLAGCRRGGCKRNEGREEGGAQKNHTLEVGGLNQCEDLVLLLIHAHEDFNTCFELLDLDHTPG
jgi:hypothetical protein